MHGFTRVGRVDEFSRRRGRAVRVGDVLVAVFRYGDRWFALQDACPHMGASLADGRLDAGHVVCHWHGWKFDLASGRCDRRSWACASAYEVRVRDGDVYVKPPPPPAPPPARDEAEEEEWLRWDPDRFFRKKADS